MVHENPDGTMTFEVFIPAAQTVHLVGSFNLWSRHAAPLTRSGDHAWVTTLRLSPGEYSFQYLVDQEQFLADFAAHGVELNAYGLWTSILRVRGESTSVRVRVPQQCGSRAGMA